MKLKYSHILFIIVALFLFTTCKQPDSKTIPVASQGVLDLRNYIIDEKTVIDLSGEWEIYWNQFVLPSQISEQSDTLKKKIVTLPNRFNKHIVFFKNQPDTGFATYRLKVLLNKGNEILAIKFNRIETAFSLFINNKKIYSLGKTGKTSNTSLPMRIRQDITFKADTNQLDIVIWVSNFEPTVSGISETISMGTPNKILSIERNKIAKDIMFFGILLIIGIYHMGIFLLQTNDKSSLFFALLCIFTAFYYSVKSDYVLSALYKYLNWNTLITIDFFTSYSRLILFSLFLYYLISEHISKKIVYIISILVGFLMLIILFFPPRIFVNTLIPFEIIAFVSIVYFMYSLFINSINKKQEAIYSLIASFIVLLTAVNDILYEHQLLNTTYLSPFGVLIFIISQSFILSLRIANLYKSETMNINKLTTLSLIKDKFIASSSHRLKIPVQILINQLGAEYGFILVKKNKNWVVRGFVSNNLQIETIASHTFYELLKGNTLQKSLPFVLIDTVFSSKRPIIINNSSDYSKITGDNYLETYKPQSLIIFPLMKRGDLKGILYLENRTNSNVFDTEKNSLLELVSSHLHTLIDNNAFFWELRNLNKNLEKKVLSRTAKVVQQKQELENQAVQLKTINSSLLERQEEIRQQADELFQQALDLQQANRLLEEQNEMIKKQNLLIKGSISYAQNIQTAILPSTVEISDYFDHFIIYKPKDIVSGDFFWFKVVENILDSETFKTFYFVVADCTGHGVPGAFMSLIGTRLLDEIVTDREIRNPAEILRQLNHNFIKYLRQEINVSRDSMDICLCKIDCLPSSRFLLTYSGAKRPLYCYCSQEKSFVVLDGVRRSVGGVTRADLDIQFINQEILLEKNDVIYLTSDGMADQNNSFRKRLGSSRIIRIILNNYQLPMQNQKIAFEQELSNWQQNEDQRDDITILGIKL